MNHLISGIVILISLVLPPLLVVVGDHDPLSYLNFPFQAEPANHAVFSHAVWWSMALFVIAVVLPFLMHALRFSAVSGQTRFKHAFPAWGWGAAVLLIPCWVLAWTRFDWFAPLQLYTFTPLWVCYIVIVNALTIKCSGRCLLTRRPFYLIMLAILSSCFWWYFEYLNGFILNWYYVGHEGLSRAAYAFHATIAYATVLPAVVSTAALLNTLPRVTQPFREFHTCPVTGSRMAAALIWIGGMLLLGLSAVYPEQLFMCVWIAPLFIITGARCILSYPTVFSLVTQRDWRPVVIPALAALICGLFWELWNFRSLAHWKYNIPYVDAYHVFEMPVLGYAGYLPFGLVCLAIAELAGGTDRLFDA